MLSISVAVKEPILGEFVTLGDCPRLGVPKPEPPFNIISRASSSFSSPLFNLYPLNLDDHVLIDFQKVNIVDRCYSRDLLIDYLETT